MTAVAPSERHPVHPVTAHIPIAFLAVASLFDVLSLLVGGDWFDRATAAIAVGLVGSLPAAVTGFVEYAKVPKGAAYAGVATTHMLLMLGAVSLYGISFAVRTAAGGGGIASWLAAAGAGLLMTGGWFGGELVYRHGHAVSARGIETEEGKR